MLSPDLIAQMRKEVARLRGEADTIEKAIALLSSNRDERTPPPRRSDASCNHSASREAGPLLPRAAPHEALRNAGQGEGTSRGSGQARDQELDPDGRG